MSALKAFYYDKQLKTYLIQFMAIFSNMQVQVGWNEDNEPRLISVPIYNASKDRIVAAIKGENTQNKPIRLPAFSAQLTNIDMSAERRKGVPMTRRQTFMPAGGLFPDDISVIEQRMPVPYDASYDLTIWASNQDQHYQIIEQILMLFNPVLQFQTSDEPFDWTKITKAELMNIALGESVPMGGDRRLIQTTLSFKIPIWLSVPANVHQQYIKEIFMRIGAVSAAAQTNQEIVAEIDDQGIPYEMVFSLDDINING